ncbi:MAG TPA: hypothetical protein GXZ82_12935 [Firmicutes bacterium]|nr:hypothetical protein [Bacillota bacterium]
MSLRVGIPRALWYYTYYPFWQTFFTKLGVDCVLSEATTKQTLDAGIKDAVSEACVPIKLFFGHISSLRDAWQAGKIDVLFVPRYVSWQASTVFCPKFLGLPDMIKHTWEQMPPIISPRIDLRKKPFSLLRICNNVRRGVGGKLHRFGHAYVCARIAQWRHEKRLRRNWDPNRSINKQAQVPLQAPSDQTTVRLAVLGYPYLLHDSYINLGLFDKLHSLGAEVVTAESLQHKHKKPVRHWSKPLFWTYTDMVARAGVHALGLDADDIDGVIHLTAFACGPDATVDKLLEIEARKNNAKPFLSLCLDEQTGEAGCLTRLEAFVDMLRRQKDQQAKETAAQPVRQA